MNQFLNPIARRESVDEILLGRLSLAPRETISGVCLRGRPGNGKRILATRRIPELFPGKVQIVAARTDFERNDSATSIIVIPEPHLIPPSPQFEQLSGRHLVVVCERISDLPEWMRRHVRTSGFSDIEVRELGLSELQHYAATLLGGPVSLRTANELGRAAGAVPGALSSIIRSARSSGALLRVGGVWELTDALRPEFVHTEAELVLADLSTEDRGLLQRIALAEPLPERQLTPQQSARVTQWIDSGLLIRDDSSLLFRVPLLGSAIRDLVPATESEPVHRESLSGSHPPPHAVRWAIDNGVHLERRKQLRSIEEARQRQDWSLLVRLTTAWGASQESGDDPADLEWRIHLLTERAVAWRFYGFGYGDEATSDLEEAARLCEQLPESTACELLRAEVQALRSNVAHYHQGDLPGCLEILDEAMRKARSGEARGLLLGYRLMHLAYAGHHQQMLAELADPSIQHKLSPAPAGIRNRVQISSCLSLCAVGKPAQGLRRALSLLIKERLNLGRATWEREELRAALFYCTTLAKGPSKSPAILEHVDDSTATDYLPDDAVFALATAWWLTLGGEVIEAQNLARLAQSAAEYRDASGFMEAILAMRAETSAFAGDFDGARECLDRASELPARTSSSFRGGAQAGLLIARYALGERRIAADVLRAGADFEAEGLFGFSAETLHVGVRFGAKEAASALLRIAQHLDGEMHALRVEHAQGVVTEDAFLLARVAEEFEAKNTLLWAAEAFACAHKHAQAQGLESLAQRCARGRDRVLSKCELVRHPLLQSVLDGQSAPALTKREEEMLEFIEKGMSNKEIATHLHLSARTVEGHISRLYRKLGATRRSPGRENVLLPREAKSM